MAVHCRYDVGAFQSTDHLMCVNIPAEYFTSYREEKSKKYSIVSAYWVIMHFFLSSADFFQNQLFEERKPSECQTVWIQIRPEVLSGLIWIQIVCKGYQQTTLVGIY